MMKNYFLRKTFPYLLILKGKHGDWYFHVADEASLQESLEKIFEIQKENGYYWFESDGKSKFDALQEEIKRIEALEEKAEGLITINDEIKRQIRVKKDQMGYLQEKALQEREYQKIVSGEKSLLPQFLSARIEYQYERIEIETYSNECK